MLGGVCGGLAEFLGINVTIVRAFFILFALTNGIGLMVYLLLWVIVPREDLGRKATLGDIARSGAGEIVDRARAVRDDLQHTVTDPHPQARIFLGAALLLVGLFFMLQNLDVPWLRWLDRDLIWPALLILAGIALLLRWFRND